MKKSEQIAGECSWSLFGSFFLCHSRRKRCKKQSIGYRRCHEDLYNINIVETDNGWVSSVDRNFAPC